MLPFIPQLLTKTVEHPLLDTGNHRIEALAVKLVQRLFIEITLQHRFGKQPHGLNRMHDVQIGIEGAGQLQGMLHHHGRVQAKVSGVQHRTNHMTSSTANMAEI
ncbi:hypothetical protein D3C84_1036360 [compost metagenome]